MIIDRITPHDGSNEYCPDCEHQIDDCVCEELSDFHRSIEPLPSIEDCVKEVTDWWNSRTFEQLWDLSAQGNEEATEELLGRQEEYNERR
jgi:hypothetical protein